MTSRSIVEVETLLITLHVKSLNEVVPSEDGVHVQYTGRPEIISKFTRNSSIEERTIIHLCGDMKWNENDTETSETKPCFVYQLRAGQSHLFNSHLLAEEMQMVFYVEPVASLCILPASQFPKK